MERHRRPCAHHGARGRALLVLSVVSVELTAAKLNRDLAAGSCEDAGSLCRLDPGLRIAPGDMMMEAST